MHRRRTTLIERIKKERPYMDARRLEAREILAGMDPKFLEKYHSIYQYVVHVKDSLPLKVKELIIMSFAAAGAREPGVRTHMRQAIEAGATPEEVLEALQTASLPGGGHIVTFGVLILRDIMREKGLSLIPG
jgi:alkylhydroperoxidase/carboxymuconolactone decarboxylase family protein YurZ